MEKEEIEPKIIEELEEIRNGSDFLHAQSLKVATWRGYVFALVKGNSEDIKSIKEGMSSQNNRIRELEDCNKSLTGKKKGEAKIYGRLLTLLVFISLLFNIAWKLLVG